MPPIKFSREWCMPNSNTFSMKPIGEFVKRYLAASKISIDPFARNCEWATFTNDINPNTKAHHHKDAVDFLKLLYHQGITSDLVILDMPWTARQISECYKEIGIKVTQKHTQIGSFYKEVKTETDKLVKANGVVLTFGYSTVGMGIKRGYTIEEILLVCGGGAHFDVICMAERKNA
jgi:hypothetical protein